jgi:asparagine synthase (glutamine-hydrolysing)
MCGIAGFIGGAAGLPSSEWHAVLRVVGQAITHRGPDDSGVWSDADAGVGLAFQRLSILDLSTAGHQPMASVSGRFVIAFNGEIYNHLSMRETLEKSSVTPSPFPASGRGALGWRGHSDTETLLAGFEAWGIDATLKACVGMFSIALWDKAERVLYLARDRMGEKPLYYGWQKGVFLFGSELKALRAHPSFVGEIDRDALALQLRHNYISAPYSIYKGIRKLPPGTWLKLRPGENDGKPVPYWTLSAIAEQGLSSPFAGNEADAVSALEARLRDSIALQMVADVPLGAFLSGGVDSSTVVALMQAQSSRPVKTFTIGFHEAGYDEAGHALAVAKHLGTDHTELYVTPRQAMEVIPRLPTLYDEPFSDSSQIPTFLVSQMTRQHVTVSLSGDAGDELFGGYRRYLQARSYWNKLGRVPGFGRRVLAGGVRLFSPSAWNALASPLRGVLPRLGDRPVGDRLHKLAEILSYDQPEALYRALLSHWKCPAEVVVGASEPPTGLTTPDAWPRIDDFEHRMMYLDAMNYLPDDILVKLDRAAMGVSLETRVPMLDHRVVEFAWALPLSMKIRNGQSKWILRQVLYKYIPKALIERPKMGFGVPIDIWLRGPLKDWAEDLLHEARLRHEGYFRPDPIREKWREHLSGTRNWQYDLWDVLMFQAWLGHQKA